VDSAHFVVLGGRLTGADVSFSASAVREGRAKCGHGGNRIVVLQSALSNRRQNHVADGTDMWQRGVFVVVA